MDFDTALEYINSFVDFEKILTYDYTSSFRLERMYAFLQEIGNPHQRLNVIHIAGSKGKGSACVIIATILKQAGYRVGLYTSPHLLDIRERIRVLIPDHRLEAEGSCNFEGTIEKGKFIELIERIRPAAEKFRDHKVLGRLSFFEVLTACAFLYFEENKVDFAVFETGLGGRLDATNVTSPIVCGITNISMEHADKLGNSLELIAMEKAGVIKAHGIVVTASQKEEVRDVILKVSNEKRARLYEIGKDINYSIVNSNETNQIFNLQGRGYSYKNLQLNLIGTHQVENAALAIAIVRSIDGDRCEVNEGTIRLALRNVSWPGRMQIAQRKPYVILDGAQNIASMKAVLSSVKQIFSYKRLICIFGISSDKDIEGVSKELDKVSDIIILTRSSSTRAREPVYLKEYFCRSDIDITDDVEGALRRGLEIAGKEDLVLVTGSLYVIADVLRSQNYTLHENRRFRTRRAAADKMRHCSHV